MSCHIQMKHKAKPLTFVTNLTTLELSLRQAATQVQPISLVNTTQLCALKLRTIDMLLEGLIIEGKPSNTSFGKLIQGHNLLSDTWVRLLFGISVLINFTPLSGHHLTEFLVMTKCYELRLNQCHLTWVLSKLEAKKVEKPRWEFWTIIHRSTTFYTCIIYLICILLLILSRRYWPYWDS